MVLPKVAMSASQAISAHRVLPQPPSALLAIIATRLDLLQWLESAKLDTIVPQDQLLQEQPCAQWDPTVQLLPLPQLPVPQEPTLSPRVLHQQMSALTVHSEPSVIQE